MSESISITPEVLKAALGNLLGIQPDNVVPTFNSILDTVDTVGQIAPVVTQDWRERQLSSLREEWGDEFDPVYDYVTKEVFPTLPEDQQRVFNNADGLRVLAEQHRKSIEQRIQQGTAPTVPEPTNTDTAGSIMPSTSNGTATPTQSQVFTQSQLLTMSPEEWKQNESAIQQAYKGGAVVQDTE